MNSNGTMFGMCNPEATGVYGHHPHHQSQHYASSAADLGSPAYCGAGSGVAVPNSESSSGNGGHHYGLQAAQAAAAAAAAASVAVSESSGGGNNASVNNNRSNSVEASGGQNSPTGIISDNGLQYANLDGSGGPGGPGGGVGGYPGGAYGHHPMAAAAAGYHYSDIHGDGMANAVAAAAAASGGQTGGFSAYLDNSTAAAAAYAQSQYPSIYGQHPHAHSLKSIRGSAGVHDFSPSSYPADFAAAAAVSKPSPAVPTYKWMQVKRNVPKPGRSFIFHRFSQCAPGFSNPNQKVHGIFHFYVASIYKTNQN